MSPESIVIKLPPIGEPKETEKRKFPLLKFSQLRYDATEAAYIVKRLIPRRGLVVVWGPPKCGKSFWLMDIFLHVAFNWVYRDLKVKSGPVVYCAFEGAAGFGKRADAFRKQHKLADDTEAPFHLSPLRMDLIRDHAALIESINEELKEDERPIAVALDTLNRSLVGSESRDEDMAAYLAAADAIREAFDCVVVIVHHCGIEASRPRGHTSLTGAVDVQIKVVKDEASNIVALLEYAKDSEEGQTIVSRLERVTVAQDDEGDDITSCAVIPGDPAAAHAVAKGKSSKGANPLRDAIAAAFDGAERITPFAGMNPVFGVKVRDVLVHFRRRYIVDESKADKQREETQRKAFYRELKRLPAAEYGQGTVDGEQWIWKHS